MGFWFLSIIILLILAESTGYLCYILSKRYLKHFNQESSENISLQTRFTIVGIGILFIFLSTFNSCTSNHTTYKDSLIESMPNFLSISTIIIVIIFVWYLIINKRKISSKKREDAEFLKKHGITRPEYEQKQKEERKKKLELSLKERAVLKASLEEKYGKITATFPFSKSSRGSLIYEASIYEHSKRIIVVKESKIVDIMPFHTIIDFSVDEEIYSFGDSTAVTTTLTSTGSMVKRGLVGGILLGGVGTLAGAATAKQTSETIFNDTEEKRFYSISLNIDSLSSPLYTMYFGQDIESCKKATGLLTVILRRNRKYPEKEDLNTELVLSEVLNERESIHDPLFEEIARFIVATNTASTSSIQRRFSIGYNRAAKIMDQLEAAGIVGPTIGGKPRTVLIDSFTLEELLSTED